MALEPLSSPWSFLVFPYTSQTLQWEDNPITPFPPPHQAEAQGDGAKCYGLKPLKP